MNLKKGFRYQIKEDLQDGSVLICYETMRDRPFVLSRYRKTSALKEKRS